MKPGEWYPHSAFASCTEAAQWFADMPRAQRTHAPCSILIDFTDIGKGVQRREIHLEKRRVGAQVYGNWVIGFPDVTRKEHA